MNYFKDGIRSATKKAVNKAGYAMDNAGDSMPAFRKTLHNANGLMSNLDGISGRFATIVGKVGENVASTSASVVNTTKIGIGFDALKYCSDMGVSWYRAIKLTGIANDARNDLKTLADNTTKTEDEIVNVLKNTHGDLKSSAGQFAENARKMSQDLGHMTESLSQSSAEISGAANKVSRNFGYMTNITSELLSYIFQDFHQTSRYLRITCLSLTTSTLVAAMTYLQNSSCARDPESMLCTAPLKSMAATAIVTGFVAGMLMPNRVQRQMHQNSEILISNKTMSVIDYPDQVQLKEHMKFNFFIPEEGIDQDVKWTEEQLDSIKTTNADVFNIIEAKKKLGYYKWTKQELEWLLNQYKDIFFNILLSRVYTDPECLDDN